MRHEDAYPRLAELAGVHSSEHDESALVAHVSDCPTCRSRLATLRRLGRRLTETPARVDVPSGLSERLAAIPGSHPQSRVGTRPKRRLLAGVAVGALGAAVAMVLGWPRDGFDGSRTVTLQSPSANLSARVELSKGSGANQQVRLVATGLAPASYNLWFAGPHERVVAASFRPDADGDCKVIGVVPRGVRWTRVTIIKTGRGQTASLATASADL